EAIVEREWVIEHELQIVKQADDGRGVADRQVASRLAAAAVEMLVAGIERDGEKAALAPFEGDFAVFVVPHRRGAVALEDVHHLLIDVQLDVRLSARSN